MTLGGGRFVVGESAVEFPFELEELDFAECLTIVRDKRIRRAAIFYLPRKRNVPPVQPVYPHSQLRSGLAHSRVVSVYLCRFAWSHLNAVFSQKM